MLGSFCRRSTAALLSLVLLSACTAGSPGGQAQPGSGSATGSPAQSLRLEAIDVEFEVGAIAYGFGGAWVTRSRDPNAVPSADEVIKIDDSGATTLTVPGAGGMAAGRQLWVVDTKALRQIDPKTGETLVSVEAPGAYYVSESPDAVWVVFDDGIGRLDHGSHKLTTIAVPGELNDLWATEDAVWITDKIGGRILRLDPTTNKIVAEVATGGAPHGIVADRTGIWVSDIDLNTVTRIDPATNQVVATINDVGSAVGITACGGAIWASAGDVGLFRIDPATNEASLAASLPGETIYGLACGDGELWLGSWYEHRVYRYPL